MLDGRGRWLVTPCYEDAADFSCALAMVVRDGLTGYINLLGAELIAPQFLDGSDSFTASGYAKVQAEGGFGVVDRNGVLVIAPGYRDIEWLEELQAWSASPAGGDQDVYFADGKKWFSGVFDGIDCLLDGADALMKRGRVYGSVQRNGQPGLPFIYRNIALVQEAQEGLAGGVPLIYEVTGNDKKELCGACAANGDVLIPLQFSSVDPVLFVPYEDTGSKDFGAHPARHLLLQGAGAGGTGVWSLALGRQVLECQYDAVHGFRVGKKTFFLALKQRCGWTIANEDGTPLTAQP